MSDKKIQPSVAEFAVEALKPENQRIIPVNEHALQTCLRENGEQIGMAATINQQAHIIAQRDTTIAEQADEIERLRMQLAACGVVALSNTPESAKNARIMHPDYMSASCEDVARAVDREMELRAEIAESKGELLDWAVERWHSEVSQRPMHNVHRRSLDDTWRQIIRRLGGDTGLLCGPAHDDLLTYSEEVARLNASRDVVLGDTVADRLDNLADTYQPGSQIQSDLYAAATVWRKHLSAVPITAPDHSADAGTVRVPREALGWALSPDDSIGRTLAQRELRALLAGGAQ